VQKAQAMAYEGSAALGPKSAARSSSRAGFPASSSMILDQRSDAHTSNAPTARASALRTRSKRRRSGSGDQGEARDLLSTAESELVLVATRPSLAPETTHR